MALFTRILLRVCFLVPLTLVAPAAADEPLRVLRETPDASKATLHVFADRRAANPIPKYITGKFCEHLRNNVLNGMDAQILRNPTLADYPLWTGEMTPDGVTKFESDEKKIIEYLRRLAHLCGWPHSSLDGLVAARADGLACLWTREGTRENVIPSPDTGPFGGRAQRVETRAPKQGIAQWTHLPLHRIRKYEIEIYARSPSVSSLSVSLADSGNAHAASATLSGLSPKWQKLTGVLELPEGSPVDPGYKLAVLADTPGQVVFQRVLLQPADHVNGADPDVVRLLKESKLPILRWPGGNFVSGYHWRDAIGPLEQRPTRPNYAWGNPETNHFGTDEFIAFCRAVGCEPLICINGGNGTPEEAAQWIEYCNGPADSPMGKLRAANGHPAPYGVKYWEVGNELWGRWQVHWTTAAGYVDRYLQFSKAMRSRDPDILLLSCGAPVLWGKEWNDTLIAGVGSQLTTITDHPLIGGAIDAKTDPLDVYRDYMAIPEVLEGRWRELQESMKKAGIRSPRLAVTELQMYPSVAGGAAGARLTDDNLVGQTSMTEAIYDVLIYHAAVRLSPFVEMITHSATVNHGGGLRKIHEQVYANPCFYAQSAFAALAGASPVPVEIESNRRKAPLVLPDLRNAVREVTYSSLDGVAAVTTNELWLSLVNRRTSGPVDLTVTLGGFKGGSTAEVRTLAASVPWDTNRLSAPAVIVPVDSTAPVSEGVLRLKLPPYSVVRVRVPKGS